MEQENTADTIKRLQGCISDLTSVLDLPALWAGNEPSQIISTLLDGLVGMLRLDFAYARFSDDPPIEVLRLAQRQTPLALPEDVGQALKPWLTGDSLASPQVIPNPLGSGDIIIAPLRLGFHDQIGVVVAASKRRDFPTTIETLLLQVSANQAAIGLQEARLLSEQRGTREQLEQKVAKRTRQLTALNLELLGEITERDRAEEELRQLAALVEHSTDFIGVSSLEGQALFLNPAGQRMVGLEGANRVRSTNIVDYIVEQERERFEQEILPAVLRDGRWEGEFHLRNFRTGASIPMLHHLFFINEQGTDRRIAMATISRDMSARRQAEKTLLESERRFSVMFNKAPFAITLIRLPADFIVDVNEAWMKLFGFTREEVVGRTTVELGINRDPKRWSRLYSEVEQKGSVRNVELAAFAKSNDERLLSCNMDLIGFGDSKYVLSTIHDISEHRHADEALREANAELAHVTRVSTLGELTASIAHEVNQPLGAIVTNGNASLRFLAREVPDLEGSREAIGCMINDAMRASEVIMRIRTLLKKVPPEKKALSINDVIQEVVGLSAGQLARNEVTLRTELEVALLVFADRVQLQQVLLNLILNGNEAMSRPGWQPRELVITSEQTGHNEVMVLVRDTGNGLDLKDHERAFDAFFTSKEGGLGLGLSISRTIVEDHGGRLWCTSNEGKGMSFHFTLPSAAGN